MTGTHFTLGGAVLMALALAPTLTPTGAAQSSGPALKKIAEFDLPGPDGRRFDYLTIDPDDHYLISAHLAADQTYVIDLRTNKVVATVKDTPGAEGVEYVSELKKFYTSNARDNTIGVVDLQQMKVVKKLKTESKPDGLWRRFRRCIRQLSDELCFLALPHFIVDSANEHVEHPSCKCQHSLPLELIARTAICS